MVGLTLPEGQNFPAQLEFMSYLQAEQRSALEPKELGRVFVAFPHRLTIKTRSHYVAQPDLQLPEICLPLYHECQN